jgi:hypothetical protein
VRGAGTDSPALPLLLGRGVRTLLLPPLRSVLAAGTLRGLHERLDLADLLLGVLPLLLRLLPLLGLLGLRLPELLVRFYNELLLNGLTRVHKGGRGLAPAGGGQGPGDEVNLVQTLELQRAQDREENLQADDPAQAL